MGIATPVPPAEIHRLRDSTQGAFRDRYAAREWTPLVGPYDLAPVFRSDLACPGTGSGGYLPAGRAPV